MARFIPTLTLRPVFASKDYVDLEVSSIGDGLRKLQELYPPARQAMFTSEGCLKPSILIVVNGTQMRGAELEQVRIDNEAEVYFVSAFAGG